MADFGGSKRIRLGDSNPEVTETQTAESFNNNSYYSAVADRNVSLLFDQLDFGLDYRSYYPQLFYERRHMEEDNIVLVMMRLVERLNSVFLGDDSLVRVVETRFLGRPLPQSYLMRFDFGTSQIVLTFTVAGSVDEANSGVVIRHVDLDRVFSANEIRVLANRLRALNLPVPPQSQLVQLVAIVAAEFLRQLQISQELYSSITRIMRYMAANLLVTININ